MRAYESEGQMIIERSSFDKLIGTTLGNYHLSQIIEESSWGPIFLARTETVATPYLIRCLIRWSSTEVKQHDVRRRPAAQQDAQERHRVAANDLYEYESADEPVHRRCTG